MEYKRVNNDINGNPRYVFHFLEFLSDEENERLRSQYSMGGVFERYAFAISKARSIGGKKYKGKDFGGGIVIQSYNIQRTIEQIEELKKN